VRVTSGRQKAIEKEILSVPVLSQNTASQFLSRHRRANTMFEESKKGNLERECIEELCNKEEAREIFENQPETVRAVAGCTNNSQDPFPNPKAQGSYPLIPRGEPQHTKLILKSISYKEVRMFENLLKCVYLADIDECSDPDFPAGCNQKCLNIPGSFHCMYVNECLLFPSICEKPAKCVNAPGMYECQCPLGFKYTSTSRTCDDVDECELGLCDDMCHNTIGSFTCHCDGRAGLRLAADERRCESIPVCVELNDYKHPEMLFLGEQFAGLPVIYLRFRLPESTKFAAEFDFRTFDPEGVVLYAESSQGSWFMLGLREGRIEVQFKNQHTSKVTSGGKAINDGQWHVISVDELKNSISVKISKEAVMSINSPESLFTSVNGKLETKFYIAGLPNRTENIIKPINPRLDGCIRGWNLMNQGASGVKEVIQEKKSKHCFVHVERGSFFSGAGLAHFNVDYLGDSGSWNVDLKMNIRPSSSTGVLFALVYNNTIPLSVAVLTKEEEDAVSSSMQHTTSLSNSSTVSYMTSDALQEALELLNRTMQNPVNTYVGGIPDDIPLPLTPVSAFYHGCMDITVNDRQLDFDEALSKHNSIKSHSCPPVSQTHRDVLHFPRE
uniref:Vitamin K-dependent protein S n=1 Tax=Nothobranchius furzeri TaxID=105023 RepID=A0A8C6PHC4_NOTFU